MVFTRIAGIVVAARNVERSVVGVCSNVNMPQRRPSPPDVEPLGSESDKSDVDGGNEPEQASGGSHMPEKRSASPLALPVVANVRFDTVGGVYVTMRASAGATVLPPPKHATASKGAEPTDP